MLDQCPCVFQDTPFLAGTCGATFALFMGLLESVLRSDRSVAQPCHRLGHRGAPPNEAAFDYVVVGAGVAGPVVASRLAAANPDWSVLLLEAGPEEPTGTKVPGFAVSAVHTLLDWNYTTVPQTNACLSTQGVCAWPRGKMVSGTGSMHGMMYTRGHPDIYNGWAALGNEGWSYDQVLPYFKKAENNGNPELVETAYHGFAGPLHVQQFPYHPPLADDVVQAGVELGYRMGDLNGANQTGVNVAQMMVFEGLRDSTPRAYLYPLVSQPNIQLTTDAHVTRVLIDKSFNVAYGVEYVDSSGQKHAVYARKEVILSAGAIGSPQLLLLSGVGPSEDLEALGIPVVQDLPVGRNLRNHVSTSVDFFINDSSTETLTVDSFNQFLRTRSGPLSGTGLTQTTGFLLSKFATDGVPDLQVFFDGFTPRCSRTGQPGECTSGALGAPCGNRTVHVRPTNVRPQSAGRLQLRSADPFDYPVIDPQYLTVQQDIDVLVDGLKIMLNFTRTHALAKWGFQLDTTPVAGCEALPFASDAYWACVVQRNTGPENHQVGSCRMGPAGDPDAVVDPELRVHGVHGLRVVDASVFPSPPNSNPVAAIIMAGEKAADMIQSAWRAAEKRQGSQNYTRPPRPY